MVSKEEQRERVVARLSESFLETGLSQTSLRQLAAVAGMSDRMLLYYFSNKSDIILTVLSRIAADIADQLAQAIPETPTLAPAALIAKAVAVTQSEGMRPFMRLWIEVIAAASRGKQPYSAVAQQIALGFMDWIEARLEGEAGKAKHANAAMIFAMIDGLALLDVCAGEAQSRLAARAVQKLSFPEL